MTLHLKASPECLKVVDPHNSAERAGAYAQRGQWIVYRVDRGVRSTIRLVSDGREARALLTRAFGWMVEGD